jgi:peroxiredoxin
MFTWSQAGALALLMAAATAYGGSHSLQISEDKAIEARLMKLRSLPDDQRKVEPESLAQMIRFLSPGKDRFNYAFELANLATEGDFGRKTLQNVTDTLAIAITTAGEAGDPIIIDAYNELAQLARLEGMNVHLQNASYKKALADFDKMEAERGKADFTLKDLSGKRWTRSALKGKVVLVNFWATWCPPCRKEMPDLDALYAQFKSKGFVILAISDEKDPTVRKFITEKGYHYPVLLDSDRAVNGRYHVMGIPKSFLYDRSGKLVAETIDMRTKSQFLAILAKAGLK